MIRLATFVGVRTTSEPVMVLRHNLYPATAITGNPASDAGSEEAMALM